MVDMTTPIENPALLSALATLKENPSAETEAAFFAELRTAQFLILLNTPPQLTEADEEGSVKLQENSALSIPLLGDQNGNPQFFAFTDWAALHTWHKQENPQTLVLKLSDLADFVFQEENPNTGLLLNPGSQNFFLPKNVLRRVLAPTLRHTEKQSKRVLLGTPSTYPQKMVDSMTTQLRATPEVTQAWLRLMMQDDEQHYLVVLKHCGDTKIISDALGKAASTHLPHGIRLTITDTDQPFGKNAVEGQKPFYMAGPLA